LTDVENQLDKHFESVDNIEFNDYAGFLADVLFDRLITDGRGSVPWQEALDGVDEVCWFVCAKTYYVSQERMLK